MRDFLHMERGLDGAIEPSREPDGIAIRAYRHEVDADPFYGAIEEAFADHWAFEPYPRELHLREIAEIDPALSLVALDGEVVAGALMSREMEGIGWIDILGVRGPWRGRGVGRALLLRAFGVLAARGCRAAMLNVDAESQTGATRLYESVGMRTRRAWRVFEKPLS